MNDPQPKGGMCIQCLHKTKNCSHLPFKTMKIIFVYADGTPVVKCTEYLSNHD